MGSVLMIQTSCQVHRDDCNVVASRIVMVMTLDCDDDGVILEIVVTIVKTEEFARVPAKGALDRSQVRRQREKIRIRSQNGSRQAWAKTHSDRP